MRRSPLVKVPLFSRKDEAGRITLANLAVSRHEEFLHHEEVEAFERFVTCSVLGSVCTMSSPDDPERFEFARDGGIEHLRDLPADVVRHDARRRIIVALLTYRIVHAKIAGALVRLAAHVSSALHVVLSAQRIHAHAGPTDVAGHHGDVGNGHDRLWRP